jgi:hypothetical protein
VLLVLVSVALRAGSHIRLRTPNGSASIEHLGQVNGETAILVFTRDKVVIHSAGNCTRGEWNLAVTDKKKFDAVSTRLLKAKPLKRGAQVADNVMGEGYQAVEGSPSLGFSLCADCRQSKVIRPFLPLQGRIKTIRASSVIMLGHMQSHPESQPRVLVLQFRRHETARSDCDVGDRADGPASSTEDSR